MFLKSNYDIKIIHENTYNNVYCITVYLCLLCFYGDGVKSSAQYKNINSSPFSSLIGTFMGSMSYLGGIVKEGGI